MNDGNNDGRDDRWDSSSDEESDVEDDGSSNNEKLKKYSFPTLTSQIQTALTTLGGGTRNNLGCMPKLNWSSPKDATWMNCGTLKCTKVGDVYLLLKSSDFVGFDLEKAWDDLEQEDGNDDSGGTYEMGNLSMDESSNNNGAAKKENTTSASGKGRKPASFEYELVLRKWCNLHPSMEFRCFVYDHELGELLLILSQNFKLNLRLSMSS